VRVHLDVLGWLHVFAGLSGLLASASLAVLAVGSLAARSEAHATAAIPAAVWLMVFGALLFGTGGTLMSLVGRALIRRGRRSRHAALLLAVPTLALVPFGTALAAYTFWTLLNDEARREFGRPLRSAR
jgi:hypothetical protein